MKKYILLLILFPALLHGANLPDSPPLISWLLFPDGLQVIDGSTVMIIANGINKEISLNGSWPKGKQGGKKLLADLIAGKRTEVTIHGMDEQCRSAAVLFADGLNINKVLVQHGFNQESFSYKCSSERIKGLQAQGTVFPVISSPSLASGIIGGGYSGIPSSVDTSGRTQYVSPYTRKDGTHVDGYFRSPPKK